MKDEIYKRANITKWYNERINVNIDTGEIIKKGETKYYRKINTEKKYGYRGNIGIVREIGHYREHEQHRLFD